MFDHAINQNSTLHLFLQPFGEIDADDASKLSDIQRKILMRAFPVETYESSLSAFKNWESEFLRGVTSRLEQDANWYATSHGHTMIRLEAGEFQMGSRKGESPTFETETKHRREINRTIAVSSTEVTVEQ